MAPSKNHKRGLASPIKKTRTLRRTFCQNCGCGPNDTSMWRSNKGAQVVPAEDNVLCNACGLYHDTHGRQRPRQFWRKGSPSDSSDRDSARSSTGDEEQLQTPSPRKLVFVDVVKSPSSPPPQISPSMSLKRAAALRPKKKQSTARRMEGIDEDEEVVLAAEILVGLGEASPVSSRTLPAKVQHLPVLSPGLAGIRPSWIFNHDPSAVSAIPPPRGFHDRLPARQISVFERPYGCCPSSHRPERC
ncbi:hypothetical protein IAU59_001126 [Kwoniella sp. CBS 9459]